MTICSKNVAGQASPGYAYTCRQRRGHEWSASAALHDTRTV